MDAAEPVVNLKDTRKHCEVCKKVAMFFCPFCKETYYCNNAHKALDWESIHQDVCEDYAFLRGQRGFIPEGRAKRILMEKILQKKEAILQLTLDKCQMMVVLGKTDKALPCAMTAYRLTTELRGSGSSAKVLPCCLLAEIFLEDSQVQMADIYMTRAQLIMVANKEKDPMILSYMRSAKGKMNWFNKKYDLALQEFADRAFLLAEVSGTKHVRFANGIFNLGLTHLKIGNNEEGNSCHLKAAKIWVNRLCEIVTMKWLEQRPLVPVHPFDVMLENIGAYFLQSIITWGQLINKPSIKIMKTVFIASHALAMLSLLHFNVKAAKIACHDAMTMLNKINLRDKKHDLNPKLIRHLRNMFNSL